MSATPIPSNDASCQTPRVGHCSKRHRRHANPFTVRHDLSKLKLGALFDRPGPLAIDVGCGPGLFACQLAAKHPQWRVLGLEIRQHLVDETERRARVLGLNNLACILANANLHLADMLQAGELALMSINFPDPWYKKRHHKRRVVSRAWLDALAHAWRPGAMLHAMTDYLPIALEMRQTLRQLSYFADLHPGDGWPAESTTGLTSEREQTHLSRKEPIYRMCYRFIS